MAAIEVNVRERASVNVASRSRSAVNVSQRTGGGGGSVAGTPFAVANGNVLTLYMVTLKQMEDLMIRTSAGDVRFSIATDQSNYYLSFSSDSPQEIADQTIEDDSVDLYDDEIIFKNKVITFPSEWTVQSVYLEGIVDGDLLNEGDAWRLAELRRVISQIDMTAIKDKIDALDEKVSPYLYDECSVEDINRMFSPITEDGLIIVPSGLITPEGTMPISVFRAITGLTPTE